MMCKNVNNEEKKQKKQMNTALQQANPFIVL